MNIERFNTIINALTHVTNENAFDDIGKLTTDTIVLLNNMKKEIENLTNERDLANECIDEINDLIDRDNYTFQIGETIDMYNFRTHRGKFAPVKFE